MCTKISLLQSILSKITSIVNQATFAEMTANGQFEAETALYQIKQYGYETLGEYTRNSFISRLFTPKQFRTF